MNNNNNMRRITKSLLSEQLDILNRYTSKTHILSFEEDGYVIKTNDGSNSWICISKPLPPSAMYYYLIGATRALYGAAHEKFM